MEFTTTAGAKYNAFTKFGLEIFRGNTFVIKAKYGKVHRVQLYYGTGYSSGASSASAGTAPVKNAKDLLTFNTDTKQNQAVMVVTSPAMFQTSTPANQKLTSISNLPTKQPQAQATILYIFRCRKSLSHGSLLNYRNQDYRQ